ncbi:MAG: hypothetical protein K2L88_02680 [Clostridiales bacterium]|nr:hypothetical protein [Clostridiales bacterium]
MTDNEQREPETDEQAQDKRENLLAWVRFAVLHILVLIPLATGLGCVIGGNTHGNHTIAFAGMLILSAGLPAVMIILVISVLIWKYRGIRQAESDTTDTTDNNTTPTDEARDGVAEEQTPSQSEREQKAIAAVNSTNRIASRVNLANYEMDSIAEGMKHAPKWGLPVGLTCFFSLFTLLIVATVLLINRIFIGAIVCAAIVGVVLITTFIVMAVSRAKATNGDISKAKMIIEGKVKACFMIGTTTTKSGGLPHNNGGTVRIQSVTYRVIVIAEGIEYGAFSKQFYEKGEKVTIAVMGKKRAKIVEDAELETNHIQTTDK